MGIFKSKAGESASKTVVAKQEFKRKQDRATGADGASDTSPDAARSIAKSIEDKGGFWGPRK